jgi:DNA-directed RNA polymerase alpha subunit
MPHFYDTCAGPIRGLYLPVIAWEVLGRENIQTIDQLRADADRLEQFDGIGSRMAQVIRQALVHVASPEEQILGEEQFCPWSA